MGVTKPEEAKSKIASQSAEMDGKEPQNLEEQAISLVGRDIFNTLIKEYTEKQWGRDCKTLPPFIIKRLPVRFTFDNNYFNDKYQGIPIGGYNKIIQSLLDGIEVETEVDFSKIKIDGSNLHQKLFILDLSINTLILSLVSWNIAHLNSKMKFWKRIISR